MTVYRVETYGFLSCMRPVRLLRPPSSLSLCRFSLIVSCAIIAAVPHTSISRDTWYVQNSTESYVYYLQIDTVYMGRVLVDSAKTAAVANSRHERKAESCWNILRRDRCQKSSSGE